MEKNVTTESLGAGRGTIDKVRCHWQWHLVKKIAALLPCCHCV